MKNNILAGACIAIGLTLAGLFIYLGINKFANKDRAVSVKGLSGFVYTIGECHRTRKATSPVLRF